MIEGIIGQASNIKRDNEKVYTKDQFLVTYPQFKGLIPDAAMDMYVRLGNACISQYRYNAMWEHAIGLFIAHFCALYMQTMNPGGTEASAVLATASSIGVVTSESADGVSYSRDIGSVTQDLNGWAAFKLTAFGVQFATLARMVGHGGSYVW